MSSDCYDVVGPVINKRVFNFIMGLLVVCGFVGNWFIIETVPTEPFKEMSPLLFLGGYFALAMGSVFIIHGTKNVFVSFLGYVTLTIPFGLVLNIIVEPYAPDVIHRAIGLTAVVGFIMMVAGIIWPAFFKSIIDGLCTALLVFIVVEIGCLFFLETSSPWLDMAALAIFCGFIGFDFAMANSARPTVNNAIKGAAELYIDFVNVFVRILSLLGQGSDD